VTDADAGRPSGVVIGAVVVAAGSGSRLGASRPKAFVELAGHTLLERSLVAVLAMPIASLAVVVPADLVRETEIMVDDVMRHGRDGGIRDGDIRDGDGPDRAGTAAAAVSVVAGGAERTDSVRAGLAALDQRCDVVLVHDAARCLTPVGVFERVVAAVVGGAAGAVPALPVVDTVKTVDARGVITGTPDRSALRAVQTPQAFAADVLRAAYAGAADGEGATDDAALVERVGRDVVVVDGHPLALKITTAEDLARAEWLLRRSP
jgi:2-C-methyl-D-erythritol 4-phosphate cytidylyltransferase